MCGFAYMNKLGDQSIICCSFPAVRLHQSHCSLLLVTLAKLVAHCSITIFVQLSWNQFLSLSWILD